MNRVLLAVLIGIAVVSLLCVGLAAAVVFSPLRAQLASTFDRFASRIDLPFGQRDERLPFPEPLRENPFPLEQQDVEGILVSGVLPGSPAEAAGLHRGDIVLEAGGQPVNRMADLYAVLSDRQAGDEIELLVQRGDEQVTLTATLDEPPSGEPGRIFEHAPLLGILPGDTFGFHTLPEIPLPRMPDGNQFPMDPPRMVLPLFPEGYQSGGFIREVTAGSPAEEAGLEAGSLILEVNGETLETESALADAIAAFEPGDRVTLTVSGPAGTFDNLSDPEVREVEVTLGENPDETGAAYLGIRFSFVRVRFEREETPEAPGTWFPQPVPVA